MMARRIIPLKASAAWAGVPLVLAAGLVGIVDAHAQTADLEARAAPNTQQRSAPTYAEDQLAPLLLPEVSAFNTSAGARLPVGPSVAIRDIAVTGVVDGPAAEIAVITARYKGRTLTASDVLDLRDDITRAYIESGFVNSGAVIPQNQDVSDGVLDIEVREGRLIAVDVSGNTSLRDSYVAARLWPRFDLILDRDQLQENFQLLVADPAIADVDASLVPGDRLGEARLLVRVHEARRFTASFGLASDRSPSVGGERAALSLGYRNIIGIGDVVGAEFGGTEGAYDGAVSYDVALGAEGASLRFSADYSSADVVEEPLSDLDIISESYSYGVGVSYPLWRGFQRNEADPARSLFYDFRLGGEIRQKHAETELLGIPFSFSPGAVDGVTDITVGRFSQDLTLQSRNQVWALRSTFSIGLSALQTSAAIAPPEHFVAWLGQVQFARRIGNNGHELLARLEAQYSPDTLFAVERYAFGGAGSVRGYRKNEIIADAGVVASVEYRVPLRSLGAPDLSGTSDWNIGLFLEGGQGWNAELDDPDVDTIASAGLSLNFNVGERVQGSVYYGHRLEEPPTRPERTFQDSGFGFQLRVATW